MNDADVDLYEVLEISPNASEDTIRRMYRFLAQRYHPDRAGTGDAQKFAQIVKARDTLIDPEKRAAYDLSHKRNADYRWRLVEQAADLVDLHDDLTIRKRILSLTYIKRKRDSHNPGIGVVELERLTSCPQEVLDFHLWYLREKNWITRLENGLLAITAEGADIAASEHVARKAKKLLTGHQVG
jgi:curved DNA-binding protein CbpA